MFIQFIQDYFYYVFLAMILINFMMGRKKGISHTKRQAVLYMAIAVFILYMYNMLLIKHNLGDIYLLLYFAVVIPLYIFLKKYLFPYTTTRCVKCGKRLSLNQIFYFDSVECETCNPPKTEEETKIIDEKAESKDKS